MVDLRARNGGEIRLCGGVDRLSRGNRAAGCAERACACVARVRLQKAREVWGVARARKRFEMRVAARRGAVRAGYAAAADARVRRPHVEPGEGVFVGVRVLDLLPLWL